MTTLAKPSTIAELADAVRSAPRVVMHGARTKASLVPDRDDAMPIDMTSLSGVIEYEPSEFVFTALAGTPLREIEAMLAEHGQYLPFDPPRVEAGATLGGALASGLSGPGRLRYGGVRDFALGVRFVDGRGVVRYAGGKVVKNVAGFDRPKLLIGSAGRLAAIAELTFKVFPKPNAVGGLDVHLVDMGECVGTLTRLLRLPLELDAVECDAGARLALRLRAEDDALAERLIRAGNAVNHIAPRAEVATFEPDALDRAFRSWRDLAWSGDGGGPLRYKVPITPTRIADLCAARVDAHFGQGGASATVSAGVDAIPHVDAALRSMNLRGLRLAGDPTAGPLLIGAPDPSRSFYARIKHVFDPDNRFGDWV